MTVNPNSHGENPTRILVSKPFGIACSPGYVLVKLTSFMLGLTIVKTLHISWRFLTKISQLFARVEKRVSCCLALTETMLEQQEQIYAL